MTEWHCGEDYCSKKTEDWQGDDWILIERGHDKPYLACSPNHAKQFIERIHIFGVAS